MYLDSEPITNDQYKVTVALAKFCIAIQKKESKKDDLESQLQDRSQKKEEKTESSFIDLFRLPSILGDNPELHSKINAKIKENERSVTEDEVK